MLNSWLIHEKEQERVFKAGSPAICLLNIILISKCKNVTTSKHMESFILL